MTLKIVVALLLLALLIYLAAQLLRPRDDTDAPASRTARRKNRNTKSGAPDGEETRPCPLCEKELYRGERVHSVVYTGGSDRVMHIMGCQYCFAGHQNFKPGPGLPRIRKCPRCGKALGDDGYLVARVFEKENIRKEHVHVLGCQRCRHQR